MSDTGQDQQVFNGRYELRRKLARGGMADVFLARDALLDRPVALKVLFPEFATDPSFVQRFRREAQAAANLSHPNIVSVFDWGEENGTYFIVMEYVEGRTLAQMLAADGPMAPDRAATVVAATAGALGFAHRNGVIHRDVKPGNVLVSSTGSVKVADFGIARAASAQDNLTQTGTVMGTATYFSPEQARGEPVDQRSDIYSLGVVLYELLAGAPPFSGDSPVSVAYKHVQEPPPPLRSRNPSVPAPLEAIVAKAMAKNPSDRYASADELHDDLQRFRQGSPVTAATVLVPAPAEPTRASTAVTPGPRTPPAATRAVQYERTYTDGLPPANRSWVFVVVLVVLLAVLAGLLFLFARTLGLGDDPSAQQVEVPRVVDLQQDEATRRLVALGLVVEPVAEPNDTVAEGTVFRQEPSEGVRLDEGGTVRIFVSSGEPPVEVPNVVGDTVDDARRQLEGLGLTVEQRDEPSDTAEAGTVIRQEPPSGADPVPVGSPVVLFVSSGPEAIPVPDVTGFTADAARRELEEAGFGVAVTEEENEAPEGQVVRTDPPANTPVPKGEQVQIVVSTGITTVPVPDVLGQDQDEATDNLKSAGFQVSVATQVVGDEDQDGIVVSQDPLSGEAPEGSTVTITIGQFRAPATSSTTTTTTEG